MGKETVVEVVGAEAITGLRSPVRVAIIDVAKPIEDLDCTRSEQPAYTSAWILACRSGIPLGSVEILLNDSVISGDTLEYECRRQLDDGAWELSPNPKIDTLPRASIVIPTNLARPDQLLRCVECLTQLDYPDYEIIVVDNRGGDTPSLEIPGTRVVREPHPGISAARNRGVSVASGDFIAFTDDDVVVDHRWLRALGERFVREPDVSVVTGLVAPQELETPAQVLFEQSGIGLDRGYVPLTFKRASGYQVLRRDLHSGEENLYSLYRTGEFGLGSNMAFRTTVLRAAGGFDEALGTGTPTCGGEDLAMLVELLAAGHSIGYEPSAIIQHSHRATMEDLERQIYGYGVGFTAMLTAVAFRDPRHIIGLAAVIPAWLRSLGDASSAKKVRRPEGYPEGLSRTELRGLVMGPVTYLRSRILQRRR
jgi:GT2 family glycosyltransferase